MRRASWVVQIYLMYVGERQLKSTLLKNVGSESASCLIFTGPKNKEIQKMVYHF